MKKFGFSIFLLCLPFFINAQHHWSRPYFEVGGLIGVSNYSGELVNSIMDIKHMHLAGGVFGRYNLNRFVSFRLQGVYGGISGDDKDSKDIRNNIRNVHFKSHILEIGAFAEFNLMGYNPTGHDRMFSPYVFLGFSVFNYNPKARHFDPNRDGEWVPLQPMHTEGQSSSVFPNRDPYGLTQLSIPMGLGFKFAVHSTLNIGFEIGFRKTFTDYLDDVAQTYPIDLVNNQSAYDQNPYRAGEFGNLSEQELMSDRTYEYIVQQNGGTFGADFPTNDEYEAHVAQRGGALVRGDKSLDWYLITGVTLSYNFIDEGLAKSRQRRKRKAGCKSAQF